MEIEYVGGTVEAFLQFWSILYASMVVRTIVADNSAKKLDVCFEENLLVFVLYKDRLQPHACNPERYISVEIAITSQTAQQWSHNH